jgi:predicted kinase
VDRAIVLAAGHAVADDLASVIDAGCVREQPRGTAREQAMEVGQRPVLPEEGVEVDVVREVVALRVPGRCSLTPGGGIYAMALRVTVRLTPSR